MENYKKEKVVDGLSKKKNISACSDLRLISRPKKQEASILFSRYGRTSHFTTESLYFHFVKSPKAINDKNFDSLCRVSFSPQEYPRTKNFDLYLAIQNRYKNTRNYISDLVNGSANMLSATRMWNISIVSAVIFGMFLMTFIYRYLGQGALAGREIKAKNQSATILDPTNSGLVLGESTEKFKELNPDDEKITAEYVAKILEDYQKQDKADENEFIKEEMKEIVKGYPIEKMIPYIAKRDKVVAAFLIGIAKKESDWGKHVPVLNGEDCFNYWGYRGIRKRMGSSGHTCFDSPEDAVNTVAKRLEFLVSNKKLDTPGKMVVVWKCGYDCSWDSPQAVKKWVSDVELYFKKFDKLGA